MFQIPEQKLAEPTLIQGHVYNPKTNEPILFAGIKIFVNDTLFNYTVSDFYGEFRSRTVRRITSADKLELEFHYAGNYFNEVNLRFDSTQNLKIDMAIKDSLSPKEIMKWKTNFVYNMPNYTECHVEGELDPFEIKK